jgi:hypothetical protein
MMHDSVNLGSMMAAGDVAPGRRRHYPKNINKCHFLDNWNVKP